MFEVTWLEKKESGFSTKRLLVRSMEEVATLAALVPPWREFAVADLSNSAECVVGLKSSDCDGIVWVWGGVVGGVVEADAQVVALESIGLGGGG